MRLFIERTWQKICSFPRCILLNIIYGNMVCVNLLQRWERHVQIKIAAGKLEIGKNCNFRAFSSLLLVGGGLNIGDKVFMNRNASIACREKITIGNNVKIANNVVIIDHDHDYKNHNLGYKVGTIVIEDGVWIGANSTVLKDTFIGANSVIAAGSVVKGVIPANTVYGNSVAKQIKNF